MKKKIKARYIIANENGKTVIYEDGEMLYEEGKILRVGHNVGEDYDSCIDYGNAIVSPGFIDLDALGDIDHALFYEELDDSKKMYWSKEYFEKGAVEAMTPEEEAFKSLYAYSQLLSHGITTAMPITCTYYKKAAETYEEIAAAAEHAKHLGIRTYLGPSYISAMHVYDKTTGKLDIRFMEEEGWKGLERAERFAQDYKDYDALLTPVMVPERIELQTEQILKETKKFATEHGLLMRLHAAQGQLEADAIRRQHGMSSIAYLESIGLLDEKTLIPHTILASGNLYTEDQSDDDLEILKRNHTKVIHCPLVYARDGRALKSFGRYRRYGIGMSMGTDTFPPDFFSNIRAGSAMARMLDSNNPSNYAKEFFEAATIGGAQALGREDLGRLSAGARADYFVLDCNDYYLGVMDDPIRTMCMCADSRDIRYVVVDGKTVLENGRIPGIDYEKLQAQAQKYYDKLKHSFIDRSAFPEKDFYRPSYEIRKK